MRDYFMPSPQLFITSGQNILKMQSGSHHFPVSSVFPWFLSKGDVNCPLAAWACFTSVPWLVSVPSPGEASVSVPTCVPVHVLSQSVWTFCSLCLDSWPQPIFPSGFLLKCHFFLTTRCLVGSCTFPLAVLLTFELTCFVWLSMRPQSFLLFGHLQEHQGSSRVHLLPCCLQHRAQSLPCSRCSVNEWWMNGWLDVDGEIPLSFKSTLSLLLLGHLVCCTKHSCLPSHAYSFQRAGIGS